MVTNALVIRENNNVGEADRFITALTRENGIISAAARGARNIKNRLASSTQLLSYSRLSLYKGRNNYIINDAEPINIFFEVRGDIEKLALAQYFCELVGLVAPSEEPADDFLSLILNCLHLLSESRYPNFHIKAVFELRCLTLGGFQPNLAGCITCETVNSENMYFIPREGVVICGNCHFKTGGRLLNPSVLAAMRHIVYSKPSNVFSFNLGEKSLIELKDESEIFTLNQINHKFKTLEFYNSLSPSL